MAEEKLSSCGQIADWLDWRTGAKQSELNKTLKVSVTTFYNVTIVGEQTELKQKPEPY